MDHGLGTELPPSGRWRWPGWGKNFGVILFLNSARSGGYPTSMHEGVCLGGDRPHQCSVFFLPKVGS